MAMRILKCTINGKPVEVGYDPRESLLDTLRDRLHLTGTKRGCEVGECGACTVLIDGVATDSCLYLTDWAQGKDILTIEGVQKADGSLDPVQQAFIDEFAVQCGFCIPGIIMSAIEMERTGKTYTRDEIRKQLSGHLCRCTGYENIVNAVEKAVDECVTRPACYRIVRRMCCKVRPYGRALMLWQTMPNRKFVPGWRRPPLASSPSSPRRCCCHARPRKQAPRRPLRHSRLGAGVAGTPRAWRCTR